ncbi:serine/threonine-protein kinase [Luteolibacter sp. Populi]|uniref:serine/threonine-protein kinase n=1 Tax=Luteolibacter sp. Populi TaxID=3230487 RepID=UPI0034656796
MDETLSCPECGKPVPADSQHRLCPACLMAQAMASRTLDPENPGRSPAPPPAPEEIADKFPQFEILECLGRGGMGVVYKARQKSLNRLVAIKILAPESVDDPRFSGRFATEAELLAKLSHPHIVTIHDFGETGGLYYLVMEYVGGVNLRDLLREGKMPPEQALAIVPPVCEALQYAHEQGIVHRDIKPENILLDRDGRVKIADFGIAALAGAAADRSGTPAYMAPEQRAAASAVDHRADIYALGAVLYEMLTGERPGNWPPAPSRRVQIDVRLDEVVLRALETEPGRRYQSAGEFRSVIDTVAAGEVPAAPGEWQLRCTSCGATRSLASAGGVRIGAASIGKRTLAWCRHCSGLRFAAVEQATVPVPRAAATGQWQNVDYRSRQEFLGWPLLHIAAGADPLTGQRRIARGWLAVGDDAMGFLAIGGVAKGFFAFGGMALGVVAYGGVAIGGIALGGVGLALLVTFGGLAIAGYAAVGGKAIGYYAYGGSASGAHVLGPLVRDPEAIHFFQPWADRLLASFALWNVVVIALAIGLQIVLLRWAAGRTSPVPGPPLAAGSVPALQWKPILHFGPALLLVIAWLSSGLERGAVLILGIVVVAVLVISAISKSRR